MVNDNPIHLQSYKKDSSIFKVKQMTDALYMHNNIRPEILFGRIFGHIPNLINIYNVNVKQAHKWFYKTYGSLIKDSYHTKGQLYGVLDRIVFDEIIYHLADDCLIYFDCPSGSVQMFYRYSDVETIIQIQNQLLTYLKNPKPNEIGLLVSGPTGINVHEFPLKKESIDLALNYNNDLMPIHETILERLKKENDKGLILLHGEPGTGKTTYIKKLVNLVKKKVLFISSQLSAKLDAPEFLAILIDNKNSILIIEDAEKILMARDNNSNSPVAALLNLTDGMLSDCLNIQVICSFNTDISGIDPALLRKGRLIAKYNFEPLTIDKAKKLSTQLGLSIAINEPTHLTSIYNHHERTYSNANLKKVIGF